MNADGLYGEIGLWETVVDRCNEINLFHLEIYNSYI